MASEQLYEGTLYFIDRVEMNFALAEITAKNGVETSNLIEGMFSTDFQKLEVSILHQAYGPSSQFYASVALISAMARYAYEGEVRLSTEVEDGEYGELVLGSGEVIFDDRKPTLLAFDLAEFESTHGEIPLDDIPQAAGSCVFYVHDSAFNLSFDNEVDMSEENDDVARSIIRYIHLNHVSKTQRPLFASLFKTRFEDDPSGEEVANIVIPSVRSTIGYVAGYELEDLCVEAQTKGFRIHRWNRYWRGAMPDS